MLCRRFLSAVSNTHPGCAAGSIGAADRYGSLFHAASDAAKAF
jgi:hypothetical protein